MSRFPSIDDLAEAAFGPNPDSDALALAHHLQEARKAIARQLWARQIFISAFVLDELLLWAASDPGVTDPVLAVLEMIRDSRLHAPGFVLFPLHSVDIAGGGLFRGAQNRITLMNAQWGWALTPQTNDLASTKVFLEEAAAELGVKRRVPHDLIDHWSRSRPTEWLSRNPLLMVRVSSLPGFYYDNQYVVLSRVRATLALIASASVFAKPDPNLSLFSSSRTNNRETLDIRHYMTFFQPARGPVLDGHCVPINASRASIFEMAGLDAQVSLRLFQRRLRMVSEVETAIGTVFEGFLRHVVTARGDGTKARVFRKTIRSIEYFRRSFDPIAVMEAETINLAIAFETLLTDGWEGAGVKDRLVARARTLLRGTRGTRAFQESVASVYEARNALVHSGARSAAVDLPVAREAYVRILVALAPLLGSVRSKDASPLRRIIEGL